MSSSWGKDGHSGCWEETSVCSWNLSICDKQDVFVQDQLKSCHQPFAIMNSKIS